MVQGEAAASVVSLGQKRRKLETVVCGEEIEQLVHIRQWPRSRESRVIGTLRLLFSWQF